MLIKIHPENPEERKIIDIVNCLKNNGVIIYPTDTVYAFGCDIYNKKAMERLCQIKKINIKKHNLSFVCYNLQHISKFTKQIDNATYKLMRKSLPGPFTFILNANSTVPKLFKNKKKEVGIRVPNNNIARNIVKELGNPIVTTSVKDKDTFLEYSTDPEIIYKEFRNHVDMVVDGGYGERIPSTIINCTKADHELIRQGQGLAVL